MIKQQNMRLGWWALGAATVVLALGALSGRDVAAQEKIGTVRQGLVGGTEVDEKTQEAYGLLSFSIGGGACSASLLRNGWAISAAHCVDAKDAAGNTMSDPNRPGQNVMRPLRGMSLSAVWGGGQTKRVTRVETFWPYDVSLIQLDTPFQVNGKTDSYVRDVFFDQFPYFGTPTTVTLKVFGTGINQFAYGTGDSAVPSSSDNKFRLGTARVSREEGALYWYPSEGGQMIAGGDSGGPSFATVGTSRTTVLVGVHALAMTERVAGKPKTGWTWVTRTPEAADAPIKPVWKQIQQIMGPLPAMPAPPPPPFTGRHKAVFEENGFFTGGGKVEENILYGVGQDGKLIWHKHWIDQRGGKVRHSFSPTKRVGDGWKVSYKGAFPAGQEGIYTLADDGELRLHFHLGAYDGSYRWSEPARMVGTGWGGFNQIIPMDRGVIYTLDATGILLRHRHKNYLTGLGGDTSDGWSDSTPVGHGWGGNKTIFSGGNGVLYVVNADGTLKWYKHKGYRNPVATPGAGATEAQKRAWINTWAEPKVVGNGWGQFTKLFSPGEGHIYGVLPNGDLMYYRHTGWADGSYVWDENIKGKIASGWNGYESAFARITTSDQFVGPK